MKYAIIALFLILSCAATAQDFDKLARQELQIQQAIDELPAYDLAREELYHQLVGVKRELGKDEEALELFNDLINNVRINKGLDSIDQVPYIKEMIEIYFTNQDYIYDPTESALSLADKMLDLASHVASIFYEDDDPSLSSEYSHLIGIRFGEKEKINPLDHECWKLSRRDEDRYDSYNTECKGYRVDRVEHFIKAINLQEEVVEIITRNVSEDDPIWCSDRFINSDNLRYRGCISLRSNAEMLKSMAELVHGLTWRMEFGDEQPVRNLGGGTLEYDPRYRDRRIEKYNPITYNNIIDDMQQLLDNLPILQ